MSIIYCINFPDSSVAISNCSHGDVRLVGGRTLTEGQVEICIDKVWGAVCDRKWDYIDANIVCSMLGLYPSGNKYMSNK